MKMPPTAAASCGEGLIIATAGQVPPDQRRLCPGPRKIKQAMPLIFGFGARSGDNCLFSVLPELINL
jgi:hypothetical protein